MKVLWTAVILVVVYVSSAWGEPMRIATEGAYPPFNYINEQGELEGFDVDIARALCQVMNRECTLVAVPWDTIIDGLVAGRYDAIVASMAKTPERDALVDFSDRYYRSRSAFVAQSDSDLTISPKGLRGKVIATAKETVQTDYLMREYSSTATILQAEDTLAIFDLLVSGEADVALSDSLNILEFLQTQRGEAYDFVGEALPAEDISSSAHIAVQEGNEQLRQELNTALHTLWLNGTYDKINRKYFPFSIY